MDHSRLYLYYFMPLLSAPTISLHYQDTQIICKVTDVE